MGAEVAGTVEWTSESEMEEEEEPLFADDLEDPPPLPPPMPSLSQMLNTNKSQAGGEQASASGLDGEGSAANGNQPAGTQNTNDQGPPQKKRKPMLTLTLEQIFSEKGMPYLEAEFPKLKFRGKTHEHADLKFLLQQYEHWANRLYPKFTFKDVTHRIEQLSNTKEFKTQLAVIRRRHARRGAASTPLVDDSSDKEEGSLPTTTKDAGTERNNAATLAGEEGDSSDDGGSSEDEDIRSSSNDGRGSSDEDITNRKDDSIKVTREYKSITDDRGGSEDRKISDRGRGSSEDGNERDNSIKVTREYRNSSYDNRDSSEDKEISDRGRDESINSKERGNLKKRSMEDVPICTVFSDNRISSGNDRDGLEDKEGFLGDQGQEDSA